MKRTRTRIQTVAIAGGLVCFAINAQPAMATFHFWDITEIYSNADGTLQFIEWFTSSNSQHLLAGHAVTTNANVYTFPNNLPSSGTGGHHFLMGTAGFAALPGAPPPDYIIPDGFIDTTGDTLRLRTSPVSTTWETFSFGAGELPTDGIHSLICAVHVGAACASTDVEVNSPTNFDGVSGSVSPCSSCPTDVDGNGQTDAFDLAFLLGNWGPVSPDSACLDADGDGIIAAFDLAVVLGAWGPCP
ncbi:MAG: hypothetical protein IID41_04190 [Planctomycetes bacterium]|nr:hypothetical protein [Planctomycetota bacterium]